jgi:hypothetical protein
MKLELEDLIDTEKKKTCLILGPGKTMTNFQFKKFKGKIIVIGDAAIRGSHLFKPDYWVVSNNHFPVPYIKFHRTIINKFNKTLFLFCESALHDNLWKKSIKVLKKKLKINWVFFDDRHFDFNKCMPELQCCKYIDHKKKISTIQESVSNKFNSNKIAQIGVTVFDYALALALLLGFSKIYIQGVDLPLTSSKEFKRKKINNWIRFSQLGYEYSSEFNKKIENKIKIRSEKTNKLISKKVTKIFKKNNNFVIYLIYYFLKKIKIKYYLNQVLDLINIKNKKIFLQDRKTIFRNVKLYSTIAKKNDIKIYNLNKQSNLNRVKDITYLKNLKL